MSEARFKVGYTSNPRSKFSAFFDKVHDALIDSFDEEAPAIRTAVKREVEKYFSRSIYPSYDADNVASMQSSFRVRLDKTVGGNSVSAFIDHPLLFARETGRTPEGSTVWTPKKGKALRIDYDRAMLSAALRPLAQAKMKRAQDNLREAQERRSRRVAKGLPAGPAPEIGRKADVFLAHAKVVASPFMGEVQKIINEVIISFATVKVRDRAAKKILSFTKGGS